MSLPILLSPYCQQAGCCIRLKCILVILTVTCRNFRTDNYNYKNNIAYSRLSILQAGLDVFHYILGLQWWIQVQFLSILCNLQENNNLAHNHLGLVFPHLRNHKSTMDDLDINRFPNHHVRCWKSMNIRVILKKTVNISNMSGNNRETHFEVFYPQRVQKGTIINVHHCLP